MMDTSHMSVSQLCNTRMREVKSTILKLTLNTTDLLQPLDAYVFKGFSKNGDSYSMQDLEKQDRH